MTANTLGGDAVASLVARFGSALRRAGLEIGPSRLLNAMRALDCVHLSRRTEVYWALRCTLLTRYEDHDAFDVAFRAFWEASARVASVPYSGQEGARRAANGAPPAPGNRSAVEGDEPDDELTVLLGAGDGADDRGEGASTAREHTPLAWMPTTLERLRHADFATYSPEELQTAQSLIARLATALPRRRSRRLAPAPRGNLLDQRQTLRLATRTGGHPIRRAWRAPRTVDRRLLFVVDVSRSMQPYARPMLMFAQAAVRAGSRVEVFSFGTRLTRLTTQLARRDPDEALRHAAKAMPDWSGGTRIGQSLEALRRSWGGAMLIRGAVVVIVSDGLERGDASLLGAQMAHIHRAAHHVIWVNPLAGDPDYAPLAAGMAAALPHVDRLIPGHDLASLQALATVLGRLPERRSRHMRER